MRLIVSASLLALTVMLSACDRKAPAIQADFPLTKLTERVYVIHGPNEIPKQGQSGLHEQPRLCAGPEWRGRD